MHAISPFTSYQFYLTKALSSSHTDWATVWNDYKPVVPINDIDKKNQFVLNMDRQDFVNAHLIPIDLYRPLVSSCFHFGMSLYVFPGVSDEFHPYFMSLFILSLAQCMLTMLNFHVSFYSRSSDCWDAIGWYFHTITIFLLRIVIPIASIIIALMAHFELENGSNSYSLLLMSHAFTCIGTSMTYVFYFKK